MTEEREIEIAIRSDEWASSRTADRGGYYFAGLSEGYYNGYIAGAEENTKLLSKRILELQQTNGALTDRVNALEKENERLKDVSSSWQ